MLDSNQPGYAVMSEDRTGISFEDRSLETCKKYCREEDIIVKVTPKVCGFSVRVWLGRYDKLLSYSRFWKYANVFRLNVSWRKEFQHKYGEEVWRPERKISMF